MGLRSFTEFLKVKLLIGITSRSYWTPWKNKEKTTRIVEEQVCQEVSNQAQHSTVRPYALFAEFYAV